MIKAKNIFIISILIFLFNFQSIAQNIYANISVDSAYSMINLNKDSANFIILDVRTLGEYVPDHLENGVNLNYYNSDFKATLDTLIKDKKYLLHCRSGSRSANAFKIMKELKFKEVYNMKGGISAWKNASYPTTKELFPILKSVTVDKILFGTIETNYIDTINITITNFGNDTLEFEDFMDLSGTEFTTDFNIDQKLTGFDDYPFKIFYSPVDINEDSIIFNIKSNGGNLDFTLFGNGKYPNSITNFNSTHIKLFPNPANHFINIESQGNQLIDFVQLFDITGRLMLNKVFNTKTSLAKLSLNGIKAGIYYLKIRSEENYFTKRIIVE